MNVDKQLAKCQLLDSHRDQPLCVLSKSKLIQRFISLDKFPTNPEVDEVELCLILPLLFLSKNLKMRSNSEGLSV